MLIVREYHTAADFEKGIDEQKACGWSLHSWRMVPYGRTGVVIVAVFSGR